jgi:large subunit ribosomal protein L7Ae
MQYGTSFFLHKAGNATKGKDSDSKAPPVIKYGINHVVQLIEEKKAKMVVIAHDVDPVEVVCWLPALCRKKEVPYCIVKNKSRLGRVCRRKTTSCMAITNVDSNDRSSLNKLVESVKANYNERGEEIKRHWGGGSLGNKSAAKVAKVEKIKAKELDEVNNLGDEIEEEEDTDDNITVF